MKAVKVVVIVLGLLTVGYLGWKLVFSGGPGNLPGSSPYVDVATGEVRSYARDRFIGIPGKNKDGQRTIVPVEKGEDGVYRVSTRYRNAVRDIAQNMDVKVNLDTWEVIEQ